MMRSAATSQHGARSPAVLRTAGDACSLVGVRRHAALDLELHAGQLVLLHVLLVQLHDGLRRREVAEDDDGDVAEHSLRHLAQQTRIADLDVNHANGSDFLAVDEDGVEDGPNVVVTQHVSHREGNGRAKQFEHVHEDNFVLAPIRRLKLTPGNRFQKNAHGHANVDGVLLDNARLEEGVDRRQHRLHDRAGYVGTLQNQNEGRQKDI